jgi:hypothetical protein
LEYFRSFYGFNSGYGNLLGLGFGLGGFYLVFEMVIFKAVLRHARRTGTLIKLSE